MVAALFQLEPACIGFGRRGAKRQEKNAKRENQNLHRLILRNLFLPVPFLSAGAWTSPPLSGKALVTKEQPIVRP
jgi:hypothetical protein